MVGGWVGFSSSPPALEALSLLRIASNETTFKFTHRLRTDFIRTACLYRLERTPAHPHGPASLRWWARERALHTGTASPLLLPCTHSSRRGCWPAIYGKQQYTLLVLVHTPLFGKTSKIFIRLKKSEPFWFLRLVHIYLSIAHCAYKNIQQLSIDNKR